MEPFAACQGTKRLNFQFSRADPTLRPTNLMKFERQSTISIVLKLTSDYFVGASDLFDAK